MTTALPTLRSLAPLRRAAIREIVAHYESLVWHSGYDVDVYFFDKPRRVPLYTQTLTLHGFERDGLITDVYVGMVVEPFRGVALEDLLRLAAWLKRRGLPPAHRRSS